MWSSPCCQCSALRSSRLTHSSSWWSRVDGTALSVSAPDPTESAEQSPLVAIRYFASLLPRGPTVPPRPDGGLLYLFNLSDRTLLHRVVYRSIVRTPAGEPAPSLTFRTIAFTLGEQHRSIGNTRSSRKNRRTRYGFQRSLVGCIPVASLARLVLRLSPLLARKAYMI